MSYYYVLGHSENPVVIEYSGLYAQQLLQMFLDSELPDEFKEKLWKLSAKEQSDFLSKSDISLLLQSLKKSRKDESLAKLQKECEYFFSWKEELCTFSLWNNIPGTNIKITLHDNNYENSVSTHPDHDSWNMVWWWEKSEDEWREVFWKAFALLKAVNEGFYNELNFIIQKIVPFNTSYGAHNSCSFKEAVWVLYLGFTVDIDSPELSILEALVHESSHNKLNLIMQTEKLTLNDTTEKYYSPYRPDARHIYGVYLWVHAIVPTVHTMLLAVKSWFITDSLWQSKAVLYHMKNKIWMKVLRKYAQCSDLWYKILDELEEVMRLCDVMIAQTPELQRLDFKDIQSQAKKHFLDVQLNYPHLEY